MLQPHTLKPAPGSRHRTKRVGRGNASGHGTYSTRGGKGQTARSGGSRGLKRLGFRRLMQSTPKLRGFKSLRPRPATVRISQLERTFVAGDSVTLDTLKTKGLVKNSAMAVKIIGNGKIGISLTVTTPCTAGAKESIIAAGGTISQ